jgi:hypothetical protein
MLSNEEENEKKGCEICGKEVTMGQKSSCNHVFCYFCINKHLKVQENCPKYKIFNEGVITK